MSDLISISRAILSTTLNQLNNTNPQALAALIGAASSAIERRCMRTFGVNNYTEYVNGAIYKESPLQLNNFPVLSISRLAANPMAALTVVNNSSPNVIQRATVSTTATSLTCISISAGVPTTDTFLYSTYTTVGALATAINNIAGGANNWVANAGISFTNWVSTDIKYISGAMSAMQGTGAILEIYTETIAPWILGFIDPFSGVSTNAGWRLDANSAMLYGWLPRGQQNIRIDYQAGFSEIPDDIQEACVLLCIDILRRQNTNMFSLKNKLGPYEYSNNVNSRMLIPSVLDLINPFMDHSKLLFQFGV